MNYKLLALDLDDTIVSKDGHISKNVINSLKKAIDAGVFIVLATGRPMGGMKHVVKELDLDNNKLFLLGFNGGKIVNPSTNEVIFKQDVTMKQVEIMQNFAKENDLAMLTYIDDEILCTKINDSAKNEEMLTKMPLRIINDFASELKENTIKAMYVDENSRLLEIQNEITKKLGDELYITFSKPFFLEFMNKNVDKGASLLFLANHLGIKREEIIAVGDSYNDLTMIKAAGLGVAMGNAVQDVKDIADYETLHIDNDGVCHVVDKFILNI